MLRRNVISIIIAALILILSLADSDNFKSISIPVIPHADKIVHLIMYAFLMFFLIIGNRKWLSSSFINYFILSFIAFSYGVFIELLQKFLTVERTGEFLDAVSNLTGILLAVAAWLFIGIFRKSPIR